MIRRPTAFHSKKPIFRSLFRSPTLYTDLKLVVSFSSYQQLFNNVLLSNLLATDGNIQAEEGQSNRGRRAIYQGKKGNLSVLGLSSSLIMCLALLRHFANLKFR